MRYLGLDFGAKTVGVAISDSLGITAQPLETIFRTKPTKYRTTISRLKTICIDNNIDQIILGNPLNFDGDISKRSIETLEFKKILESKLNLPVVMWDERCTTIEADEVLNKLNVKQDERKKYIDKIAASIILKDYMDNLNLKSN